MTESGTKRNYRAAIIFWLLAAILLLLIGANLLVGSVSIPAGDIVEMLCGQHPGDPVAEVIIFQSRIPMIITAALAGAALAVCGLLLQTLFNNPLADPSILGISTGASLGVAVVTLITGAYLGSIFGTTVAGYLSTMIGALVGALVVLMLLLIFSSFVKNALMLLIIGILISYLASSAIALLNFFATQEGVHSFVIWGLGNFAGVTPEQLPVFVILVTLSIVLSLLLVKPLNALLLGTRYAENLGVNIRRTRNLLLLITGILTAIVTAFCGPISFVGLVVPHIARLMLNTSNHNTLLPVTIITGAVVALLCTLISVLPTSIGVIPINAITPIIGVPIIIYLILNRHKLQYFN